MEIEYVNGYWVPANDIHIESWKSGQPFTQNKGLVKFMEYLERKDLHFKTVCRMRASHQTSTDLNFKTVCCTIKH